MAANKKPIIYYLQPSPPSRCVVAIARMLNIDAELKPVQLFNKEQMTPEYMKLNPFHQIPTFVDHDGFVLIESRAICTYMIQSRQPDSLLYPRKDLKQQATVDRWLYFDSGFFTTMRVLAGDILYGGGAGTFQLKMAQDLLKCLDKALMHTAGGKYFLLGDENQYTVADISMYCTTTMVDALPGFDLAEYGNLYGWYQKVAQVLKPYDQDGMFSTAVDSMRAYLAKVKETQQQSQN